VADPKFFQTSMGREFYTHHVPRIVKSLERIADNLDQHKQAVGIWECAECGSRQDVTYQDAIVIGTPYCTCCNEKHGRLEQMKLLTMK
jgi:hypothetical protein